MFKWWKKYKDNSGLWRYKKCVINNTFEQINDEVTDKKFILQILKQNTELIKENSVFKQLMIEQSKSITELAKKAGNTNNINNINTNNKKMIYTNSIKFDVRF